MSVSVTQELTQQAVTVTGNPVENNVTVTVSNARGPAGADASGAITSATASDGTANLSLANVTTVTAEVTDTLIAPHIHGNIAGSVYAHVRAGEALTKGDPVYVSGSHGSGANLIPVVSRADASNAAKMPAVGIVDEDIGNNSNGHMVITGTITELNTAAYSINAELYVAAGGGLTATPPTARAQPVARVERANANNGAILVKVNGLSASDATPSTLVRRDANGGASLEYPTFGSGFQITEAGGTDTFGMRSATADTWSMYGPDYGDFMSFSKAGGITFSPSGFAYGTGAAAAHRTALGLGNADAPTFGGADFFTSTTTTLNVYNTLSGANFERLSFRWASNVARIGTAKGGTGTARDLVLETDGTERVRVTAAGAVTMAGDLTANSIVSAAISSSSGDIIATPAGNQFALATGKRLAIGTGGGMPMLAESSGTLRLRNVANNAFFPLSCGNTTVNGNLTASGDIEATDSTKGVILKSPDGNRWRVTVDNTGALTTTAL